MTSFFRKLGWLRRRPVKEAELEEELRFHLEEEAGERQAHGLAAEEARRAARRELGNFSLVQEDTRASWTLTLWDQLAQDIRYGLLTIAANKNLSAMAILSLALGIGANTAIFSFMDAILLRSLPVPDPESLVILSWHAPRREFHGSNRHKAGYSEPDGGYIGGIFSYPAFELLHTNETVFSSLFGYQGAGSLNLTIRGQAELANGEYVSGDYFRGLGIAPAAGRLIVPDDDRAGGPAVAVISFALSQKRFGGPENAAGQAILINKLPFTVIGVTPPEFFGVDPDMPPDIYFPMHANQVLRARQYTAAAYLDPNYDWVVPMARLRPGVTAQQAQAALTGPFQEWNAEEIILGTVAAKRQNVLKVERFRSGGRRRRAAFGAIIGFGVGFALGMAGDCSSTLGPCFQGPGVGAILGGMAAVIGGATGALLPGRRKELIYRSN